MKKMRLENVQMKDDLWVTAMDKNLRFLLDMQADRVLAGFRRSAAIETNVPPYGGWEDSLIAGHAVGHYFSALAMAICVLRGKLSEDKDNEVVSTDLKLLEEKADVIVSGLLACQKKVGNGFLSAATIQDPDNIEIQFDSLEGKAQAQNWVPWYALHKVLQGLIDLWIYSDTKGAKECALDLAEWVSDRALSWSDEIRKQVLSVEYGGVNDSLYQLYRLTGNEKYKKAAGKFDEPELYSELLSFKNRLRGVHANATIPKLIGYLAGREEDNDEKVKTAKRFWDLVVSKHTYATGGIGDMEHFFDDGMLDASRTQCNAESCVCYNMMKFSQTLFMLTSDVKYLDYIDKTLWNAKLGSVGPSGGYTYFNPMATGYYRLYSPEKPEDNPFWCCVGTALEDFAKVADQIYYQEDDDVIIAQWISSDLKMENGGKLELRVDYETGKLTCRSDANVTVKLRVPRWLQNRASILPDEQDFLSWTMDPSSPKELSFDMEMHILELPDNDSVLGFSYGPFVLCVPLGNEKWGISAGAGIQVVAPAWKVVFDAAVKSDITYGRTQKAVLDREFLNLPEGETLDSFKKNFRKYIKPLGNTSFRLTGMQDFRGEKIDLELSPYYRTGNERYGIYWMCNG